jgi:hypothetical protein
MQVLLLFPTSNDLAFEEGEAVTVAAFEVLVAAAV